jgi:hypothetical protein
VHCQYLYLVMGMKTNMTTHVASLARLCYAFENQRSHNEPRDTLRELLGTSKGRQACMAHLYVLTGINTNMTTHDSSIARLCYALKIKGRTTRLHIHNECSWVRLKQGKRAWPLLISSYGHGNKHDDTRCKPCATLLCIENQRSHNMPPHT